MSSGTDSNCDPCKQATKTESIASMIDNLIRELFGEVEKTVVNGRAVWAATCSTTVDFPTYPRNTGEGWVCYIYRVLNNLITGQVQALSVRITTAPTTLTETDTVLLCQPATNIAVTLPKQSEVVEGKVFEITLDAAYEVVVSNTVDTINGAANFTLDTEGETLRVINTKTGDWRII